MDANSLLMNRFKMQCNKFSGTISNGLGVVKKRLIREMVFGIQSSKDVKLSNIGRSLKEDIPLIKTEDSLSRNLSSEDITEHLNKEIMRLASNKIDDSMVIAIDPGDIMKPYAKEMEKLCNIYDGSQGELARGYHLCQVTAANLAHDRIVPLYCEAYSSEDAHYPGSSEKIMVQRIFILSKRFFGVPTFFNYAMADGIFELLKHSRTGVAEFKSRIGPHHSQFQLSLFPD